MKLWRKLNKGCVLLIAIPLLILVALLLFSERVWGGSIKPSLDTQYVPTAQWLIANPVPTPDYLSIDPPPDTKITSQTRFRVALILKDHNNGCVQFCIDSDSWNESDKYRRWSYVYLNNQRISHLDIFNDATGVLGIMGLGFNLNLQLPSGLHLFRIQIGSSFSDFLNPDPQLSYEWAYRVE